MNTYIYGYIFTWVDQLIHYLMQSLTEFEGDYVKNICCVK